MEELRLGRVIMRKTVLTIVLALVMIAAFLVPAARNGSAAVGVKVGDYWKYSSGADVEGMSASINEKMKVTGTEGSGSSEVYVITLSGSGAFFWERQRFNRHGLCGHHRRDQTADVELQHGVLGHGNEHAHQHGGPECHHEDWNTD